MGEVDLIPGQGAQLGDAQAMPEGDQDHGGVAQAVPATTFLGGDDRRSISLVSDIRVADIPVAAPGRSTVPLRRVGRALRLGIFLECPMDGLDGTLGVKRRGHQPIRKGRHHCSLRRPSWPLYRAWLDALRNADTNANGTIELSEVVTHVQTLVPKLAEGLGGRGRTAIAVAGSTTVERQTARFGSRGEDFTLVRWIR